MQNLFEQQRSSLDQVNKKLIVDFEMAFILGKISFLMALRQHTPYFRGDAQRMFEYLKNEIAIFGTKAMPAQSCQGQGMRSVVCQIEPALD